MPQSCLLAEGGNSVPLPHERNVVGARQERNVVGGRRASLRASVLCLRGTRSPASSAAGKSVAHMP